MRSHNKQYLNPLNVIKSFPKLPIKCSHNQRILMTMPTLLGNELVCSSQIKVARQVRVGEAIGANIFVTRGQSIEEHQNGQMPKNKIDGIVQEYYEISAEVTTPQQIAQHQQGDSQFISATVFLPVSRLYTTMNSLFAPMSAAHFTFDLRLLSGAYHYTMSRPHIENKWEAEVSIMKPVPEAALLGYRRYAFGFGLGRFIYNELYIDLNLCSAEFIQRYEEYRKDYEALAWNNYNQKERKIDFTNRPNELGKLIELHAELYKEYNTMLAGQLKVIQTTPAHTAINIDGVVTHFKEKHGDSLILTSSQSYQQI
jgi:hypothetical protein